MYIRILQLMSVLNLMICYNLTQFPREWHFYNIIYLQLLQFKIQQYNQIGVSFLNLQSRRFPFGANFLEGIFFVWMLFFKMFNLTFLMNNHCMIFVFVIEWLFKLIHSLMRILAKTTCQVETPGTLYCEKKTKQRQSIVNYNKTNH